MGKIHATMNISLDGCCDHTQVLADDEFHERVSDLFEPFAALLFGRKTYDLLRGYWPGVAASEDATPGMVRLAHILNEKPKYVVSRTPPAPGWKAQQIAATQEAIRAIGNHVNGNILVVASPMLARTVLHWALLDQYHVAVSPMVAGHGPYFLQGLNAEIMPSLLDVHRLASGVVFLQYGFSRSAEAA